MHEDRAFKSVSGGQEMLKGTAGSPKESSELHPSLPLACSNGVSSHCWATGFVGDWEEVSLDTSQRGHGPAYKSCLSFHPWKTVFGTSKIIFPNTSLMYVNFLSVEFIIYFLLMNHLIIFLGEQNFPAVGDLNNAEITNYVIFFQHAHF